MTTNEVITPSLLGGTLPDHLNDWAEITDDSYILEAIKGYKIEFEEIPQEVHSIREYSTSPLETTVLDTEVQKLLSLRVIEKSSPETGQVISPIFLREKPDGSQRMILNLKKLNEDVVYKHFKMDTLEVILNLVDKNSYMTTIDIKNAYYALKIHDNYQKYLKFTHRGVMYKFICLPNGLSPGPRVFTKIMKPVLSFLRLMHHAILAIYIDDLINLHRSKKRCAVNTQKIVNLLEKLGFHINIEKSCTEPSQIREFLGFVVNSKDMTIALTDIKKQKLVKFCQKILAKEKVTIRETAKLIGKFTSSCLGVKFGPLHYRYLDKDKTLALSEANGKYNALMEISNKGREDIQWWIDNTLGSYNHIGMGNPTANITTDACFTGWGGTTGNKQTHGLWHVNEIQEDSDINILELKAILFSLKSLIDESHKHYKILSDNTTAVHCINNMGTCRSLPCHSIVMEIWNWARENHNWLTATHIPGKENIEADALSRIRETSMEWKLNEKIFQKLVEIFGFTPDIDLFASRINTQLPVFASFQPDPEATHINAFTLDWGSFNKVYCFPPFAIIGKVIRKMIQDDAEGIIITPNWKSQYWYPLLLEVSNPHFISSSTTTLYLPNSPDEVHPMKKLVLVAWRI